MTSNFDALRTRILQQMAELQSMEYGSLKEEYRTNSSGGTAGPYYQLQAWHEGANLSRRVPTEEAPALKEAITNRQKFEALAEEFIEMTVEMTRKQTSAEAQKKRVLLPREAARDLLIDVAVPARACRRATCPAVGRTRANPHFQTGHLAGGLPPTGSRQQDRCELPSQAWGEL